MGLVAKPLWFGSKPHSCYARRDYCCGESLSPKPLRSMRRSSVRVRRSTFLMSSAAGRFLGTIRSFQTTIFVTSRKWSKPIIAMGLRYGHAPPNWSVFVRLFDQIPHGAQCQRRYRWPSKYSYTTPRSEYLCGFQNIKERGVCALCVPKIVSSNELFTV